MSKLANYTCVEIIADTDRTFAVTFRRALGEAGGGWVGGLGAHSQSDYVEHVWSLSQMVNACDLCF